MVIGPAHPHSTTFKVVGILVLDVGFGVSGASVGFAADEARCNRRHRGDTTTYFLFGPCFLVADRYTGAGWYVGSTVGAAMGGIMTSEATAACPRLRSRVARSTAGALLGAAPAVAWLAAGHSGWSGWGARLATSTPLLQTAGVALATRRCRRRA